MVLKLLLYINFSFSALVGKELHVKQISKNLKGYTVSFMKEAGVYKADQKYIQCLSDSIKKNDKVRVRFESKTLEIKYCEKAPRKK